MSSPLPPTPPLKVFGTPLVCRIVPMTGRELYDRLYLQFRRFLQGDPLNCRAASLGMGRGGRPTSGFGRVGAGSGAGGGAGAVGRLRLVDRDGTACCRCRWTESCVGCLIPPTDEESPVQPGETVAVDWHMSVM
ncbi:unnamed protein product, partial [Discosporangium mesarthrocarpum]